MPAVILKCDGCTNRAVTVLATGSPTVRVVTLCADCLSHRPDLVPDTYQAYSVPEYFKHIGDADGN